MRFMHMGRADLRHRDCRQARGVDPGGPWSELNIRSSITHPAGAGHPHTHPLYFIPRGPGGSNGLISKSRPTHLE